MSFIVVPAEFDGSLKVAEQTENKSRTKLGGTVVTPNVQGNTQWQIMFVTNMVENFVDTCEGSNARMVTSFRDNCNIFVN